MNTRFSIPSPTTISPVRKKVPAIAILHILIAVLLSIAHHAAGQQSEPIFSEVIKVSARPWGDSVSLRWAPISYAFWQTGIRYGYSVERYVLTQNGSLVSKPQKKILVANVRVSPEVDWEPLVHEDPYAAIAAQAMYGDRFEVDLAQSDILTIVNKARENEQRFAFALFASDMSPVVARASALWYTDRDVRPGEKYLYRVVIHSTDSLRGSIFIAPDEPYVLPVPENLQADVKEGIVSLRWDDENHDHYTAWKVERSDDGRHFSPLSETPMLTVSPEEHQGTHYNYAIDSVQFYSRAYYYRVKGVTPFGELGPPSEVVSISATPGVDRPPYIISARSDDNQTIRIEWEFPAPGNPSITGFIVDRSAGPDEHPAPVSDLLPATTRSFSDTKAMQNNYYRVTAMGLDGGRYPSLPYLGQLIDSIPPSVPVGVKAVIKDSGAVAISWEPNDDADIFGYRIYKANQESEEFTQLTVHPVARPHYRDSINLHTLNESVYYRVMAIDRNQNHSGLSSPLRVHLPDKVAPQAPVFLPVKTMPDGVVLSWIPSASDDVVQYAVYRKPERKDQWERIFMMDGAADTVFHYTDKSAPVDQTSHYTLLAIDEAGLESAPATPVSGSAHEPSLKPKIHWRRPVLTPEENRLTLRWEYPQEKLRFFHIYTHNEQQRIVLYKTLPGDKREFSDLLIPGQRYTYRIVAVFENGRSSAISDALFFQY